MKNTFINNKKLKQETLDWSAIQSDMRNKLGVDIYESWLKKIDFVEEINNYILVRLIQIKKHIY